MKSSTKWIISIFIILALGFYFFKDDGSNSTIYNEFAQCVTDAGLFAIQADDMAIISFRRDTALLRAMSHHMCCLAIGSQNMQCCHDRRLPAIVRSRQYRQAIREIDHGVLVGHEVFERDATQHEWRGDSGASGSCRRGF